MKFNKIAVVAICAALLAMTGCSKKAETKSKEITKDNIKIGFVYIGSINDEGYTQAHDRGRLAVEKMGYKCAYIENIDDSNTAACESAIRNLIEGEGCNVIFTTSFGFMDGTANMAKEYPNVIFNHCSSDVHNDSNLGSYFGKIYQARYLAGIAAGLRTQANKIGYAAAFAIPECIRGINAFTLGVQSVNPDATVEVVWTSTWYDPAVEKQAALELLNKGCDVIEQHQDTTAPQIAAQEKGAWCLGYNVPTPNAAPKAYLTAPIFDWTVYYTKAVQSVLDKTWTPTFYWGDMSTGLVGLDNLSSLCAEGTKEAIDPVQKKIASGEFDPFMGPLYDQEGTLKVAAGSQMKPEEIWNMNWFVKGVIGKTN